MIADKTWAKKSMASPLLNGGSVWDSTTSCYKIVNVVQILCTVLPTFDCWSDQAAMTTPTVRRVTAKTCILENLLPQRYPAAIVVMLPPDRRMICIGTEML